MHSEARKLQCCNSRNTSCAAACNSHLHIFQSAAASIKPCSMVQMCNNTIVKVARHVTCLLCSSKPTIRFALLQTLHIMNSRQIILSAAMHHFGATTVLQKCFLSLLLAGDSRGACQGAAGCCQVLARTFLRAMRLAGNGSSVAISILWHVAEPSCPRDSQPCTAETTCSQ